MWTDGIILLGALICAVLSLLAVLVGQVGGDGTVEAAASSLNKWNSSEIWRDLPKVPAKWGEQYDLKLERDCGVQEEFVPIITMPTEMIGDLFAKPKQAVEEQHSTGLLDRGRTYMKQMFSKGTKEFEDKFGKATEKVKSLMSDFQNKKTDAVKNVKATLDRKTDGIEFQLNKVSKNVGCEESAKKCIEEAKAPFEEYRESLQEAMDPCFDEMKDAIKGHESRIDAAKREIDELLNQLKSCLQGESSSDGVMDRFSAVFGSIKCTTKTVANLVKNQLGSALKKLGDAVKKAGTLKKEVDDAKTCIAKQDEVEKQKAKLVEMMSQCK